MIDTSQDPSALQIMRESALFAAMTDDDLRNMLPCSQTLDFQDQDIIISEGQLDQSVYLILEGSVDVIKFDAQAQQDFKVVSLGRGEIFGEISLLGSEGRTATIRANGSARMLTFNRYDLAQCLEQAQRPHLLNGLLRNSTHILVQRLVDTNRLTLEAMRQELALSVQRTAMAQFIVLTTFATVAYSFISAFLLNFSDNTLVADIFNNVLIVGLSVIFVSLIYYSPYPLRSFGFTQPQSWLAEIIETLLWSLGLIVVAIAGKWVVMQLDPAFSDIPLLILDPQTAGVDDLLIFSNLALLIYALLVPFQEIIVRGALQSSLAEFFADMRGKHLLAILLSNGLFAMAHLHVSLIFATLTFFAGLAWGVQYARRRNLIGITVSHIIVGVFALRFLGIGALLRLAGV